MKAIAGFCFLAIVLTVFSFNGLGASASKPDEILKNTCTVCHSLGRVRNAVGHKDKSGWLDYISRMQQKGARIDEPGKDALADYLANLKQADF